MQLVAVTHALISKPFVLSYGQF